MRRLYIIAALFTLVGLITSGIAFYNHANTRTFLNNAVSVPGQVIDIQGRRSSHSSSTVYYAVVGFESEQGPKQFRDSIASSSPSYYEGEEVEVLYNPKNPDDARIRSFSSLHMTTLIMSVFSAAFLGVGITIFYILLRNARTKSALRLNGQRVEASITHVKIDKSFNLNGEYPYRIYARWKNPVNNQTHNFQSEHIWFDPAPFMNGRTEVSVYIDAHNPDKHAVDLDFISTTTSV